jgi:hypothetical protein
MHGRIEIVGAARRIPRVQHAIEIDTVEERQRLDARRGLVDDVFEEGTILSRKAAHRGGVEKLGGVAEHALQRAALFREGKNQIELRLDGLDVEYMRLEALQLERRRGMALQRKRNLVQRIAARVAPRTQLGDEPLEGHLLVRERLEHGLADLVQEFGERPIAGEIGAHDERVDEVADQAFELEPVTAREGHADCDIPLPALAHEQHLECREQHHEQRDAVVAGERAQPLRQRPRQFEALVRATLATLRRTRPVCR